MDVALGVLGLEEQQLRGDQVGHLVGDRRAEEDDAVLEQAREDVERALTTTRLLDDDRNQIHAVAPLPREYLAVSRDPSNARWRAPRP